MRNVIYENKSDPYTIQHSRGLSTLQHLHKEIEIIYVTEGQCVAHADRFCVSMKTGDLFISFPNQIHYYENSEPGIYNVLILSPNLFFGVKNLFKDFIPENNVLHIPAESEALEFLKKTYTPDGEYPDTKIAGYLNLLMCEILPRLSLKPRLQSNNSTLKSILGYCSAHYSEDITLDNVSEELHLSKYYISRLLNSKINISFNDYINTLRINEACDLLFDTDKKIADISEDVGFGTIRSFNRAFQRIMKMTPIQYRDLQQNQSSDLR